MKSVGSIRVQLGRYPFEHLGETPSHILQQGAGPAAKERALCTVNSQLLLGRIVDQLGGPDVDCAHVAPELLQHESVIHGMRPAADVAQLLRPGKRRMYILQRPS